MRKLLTLMLTAILMVGGIQSFGQGTTTSGMNGRITDSNGDPLPNATVVSIHNPTGTQFAGVADLQGYFRIPNMDVGGPYTVTISYVGFKTYQQAGIILTLGQTFNMNVKMSEATSELTGVTIVANQNDLFDGNRTGAETVINDQQITAIPSVQRSISDFTRLTPQASIDDNGGISLVGTNNRYNAITIDGAVNNDVFGLAASGTNGGQTGGTPISIDAIQQFQIVMAPFDVRQGGFTGGSINAVTRRGSNQIEGSAYYFMRNEALAGKTPTDDPDAVREKLADFSSNTFGFRVGGPIKENKLFFFVNAEIQRDQTPQPFDFTTYEGNSTEADLTGLSDMLMADYGYDPGNYMNNTSTLDGEKVLLRLDYNINATHNLTVRHSYVNNVATLPSRSSSRTINFFNNGQYFPSVTNSTAVELKSNFTNSSNDLIIGFTSVRDDRDPVGDNFPNVIITDGSGTINLGSEPYSTGNQLDQDILTITDNFSIYKGKHTITVGTHNEFSHTYNLFMRKAFGEYRFASVNDFMTGALPTQYERGYSLIPGDNVIGDGSAAAADFNMMQLGFYAQDEFYAKENLKLTLGVRIDVPIFSDQPTEDTEFNSTTIPMLEAAGWDLMGARAGQMPGTQIMVSPRFGFNWDVKGDKSTQLRGGVGIFTSRLPLVWPGGSYTNNGLTIGGVFATAGLLPFKAAWDDQYTATDFGGTDPTRSGQIDLFTENFKFPQVLRVNLALDKKLPYGLIGTVEGVYSKTLNNVQYYNVNLSPDSLGNITSGPDTRPYFSSWSIDPTYTRIMVGYNTNEGYAYSLTGQIEKPLKNGFYGSLSYTYGQAMAVNDGTSSQNSSQWRYNEQVGGLNHIGLTVSDFSLGHRVVGFLSYRFEYAKHFATTLSLVYSGQSGSPFSYVYNDYNAKVAGSHRGINGEASQNEGNLIWIPANQSEINLVDYTSGGTTVTAAEQWADLDEFITNDDYLSANRGAYADRNGARHPFTHILDLKVAQDFYITMDDGKRHRLQLTLDVFNFTNMLNPDWGRRWWVGNDAFQVIDVVGFEADGTTPEFNFKTPGAVWNIDDSGILSSRWQVQFGVRYIFP